jgi:tetratricopeptide (TPR) repeat protein
MKKGESIFERLAFGITIAMKMLLPPLLSFERLERYCKQRIKQNPSAYSPRWFLADLYKFYQKDKEALIEYQQLDNLGYLDEGQQFSYAEMSYRLNNFDEAIAHFLVIGSYYANDKTYNYYVGMSFVRKALYGEAISYLTRATTGSNKMGPFFTLKRKTAKRIDAMVLYEAIGFCFFNLGKLELSADAYRRALTVNPNSPRALEIRNNTAKAHIHLANQLLAENQNTEAIRQFHLALEIQPQPSISQEILKTLSDLGDKIN